MEEKGKAWASPDVAVLENLPAMQESQETLVQSLGQEDPLEEGMTTLLQYPCLGNPRDRRALQATVHRVAKSQTGLKCLSTREERCGGVGRCELKGFH